MEIRGVITGDIIKSTTVKTEWRETLLNSIRSVADELALLTPLKLEFFRGDSFQVVVANPEEALKVAVLLRAGLKSKTPQESKNLWDARIALGIGVYLIRRTKSWFRMVKLFIIQVGNWMR
jgi:hypothetical protein